MSLKAYLSAVAPRCFLRCPRSHCPLSHPRTSIDSSMIRLVSRIPLHGSSPLTNPSSRTLPLNPHGASLEHSTDASHSVARLRRVRCCPARARCSKSGAPTGFKAHRGCITRDTSKCSRNRMEGGSNAAGSRAAKRRCGRERRAARATLTSTHHSLEDSRVGRPNELVVRRRDPREGLWREVLLQQRLVVPAQDEHLGGDALG